MRHDEVDWGSGEVVSWDLGFLDQSKPLSEQIDGLTEDLAQVRYPGEVLVDIGWYPEFSETGKFTITVVRKSNWDEPLAAYSVTTVDGLYCSLSEASAIATNAARREAPATSTDVRQD